MPAAAEENITDFPFIAHHGGPDRPKRKIPTFVRAHVMNRYHRERRAKKGVQQNGNSVWSHYEFLESPDSGQIIECQNEGPIRQRGTRNRNETIKPPRPMPNLISCSERKSDPESEDESRKKAGAGTELAMRSANKRCQRLPCVLVPNDAMETGGPRLISVLESYYGVPDRRDHCHDPWHKLWTPFAFSDPVLFHASLSKFPLHLAASVGSRDITAECLKHKGLAIKKISERLRDSTQPPTDQLIAAVICLLGSEMITHDVCALKAHLNGVRKMIAMRGGVTHLGFNGVLLAGYLSYEYVIAAMAREIEDETGLPSAKFWGVPDAHQVSLPAQYGIFTLGRVSIDPTSHGFSQENVLFLRALCLRLCVSDVFVNLRDCRNSKSLEALIREYETKEETEVARQEIDSSDIEIATRTIVREDHVLQALIQTAMIQFPQLSGSPVFTTVERIRKLHYHLSHTDIYRYWKPLPGALLWCFMVGMKASKDCPERPWFVSHTIRFGCGIAFENLEGLRIALEAFHRLANQQEGNAEYLNES